MTHATTDRSLLAIARECRERAEAMTGDQLDDWYMQHVGYRPSVDDPLIRPAQHCEMVASTMYFLELSPGYITATMKQVQSQLAVAILNGVPL